MSELYPVYPFEFSHNPCANHKAAYGKEQSNVLNADGLAKAKAVISAWPGYGATPLVDLPGIAESTRVASVHYKDESHRFGLKSFKPLGGAYAVAQSLLELIEKNTGREVKVGDVIAGAYAGLCAGVTVTAATDGNHGRSVAWGARMFGCRCVIFINEAVSSGREKAIAAFGAQVIRNPGSYDDAVRKAAETANSEGWYVIPDTTDSLESDSIEAPRNVTQGYGVMADEAINQLPYESPTHMFLQAGVGGMAAATCAVFWEAFGKRRPKTILVEPETCACWFHSLNAGQPVAITGETDSLMGGLACGEVSRLAWEILKPGADAAITLPDEAAAAATRLLANGTYGDAPVVGGESGVAGLAGFLAVANDSNAKQSLGLDKTSRVLLFGTEGATDPEMYFEITGRTPEEVLA